MATPSETARSRASAACSPTVPETAPHSAVDFLRRADEAMYQAKRTQKKLTIVA